MHKWKTQDIPDQTGKVFLITGANSGLGYECSRILARKGATIVMAVRTPSKGEAARLSILKETPDAQIDVMQADMASLSSIRAFADAFKAAYDRLDVLCNNAGVMAIPRQETEDGFEMQLGVNHLGHFALTGLLMDVLAATPGARIHNVTSSANWTGSIQFDDLMLKEDYGRWASYGQSKLANIFFTFELQKRLDAAGQNIIANTSHPGLVMTNLQANSVEQSDAGAEQFLYNLIGPLIAQDVSMGVLPMLYGMTAPQAKGGEFYGPRLFRVRGYPTEQKANDEAYDADALRRFWEISAELTGVDYDLSQAPA